MRVKFGSFRVLHSRPAQVPAAAAARATATVTHGHQFRRFPAGLAAALRSTGDRAQPERQIAGGLKTLRWILLHAVADDLR
jgi:hypothetical protein